MLPAGSGRVDPELKQQLVEIARPGCRAGGAWRLGEGVKAVSWIFDVEGEQTVVAKFFRPESQERMARELGFHDACTLDDPKLPQLLGFQPAIPGEQLGVVLTNCLMGQRLADEAGATEQDKRGVYVESSSFLRRLHGVAMPGFGALGAPPAHRDAREMAVAETAQAIDRRRRVGDDPALTDRVEQWMSERAASVERDVPAVLCHGDYSMWNMLVEWREGRHTLTGVLDFESAYAGDPLMELASSWVLTDSWGGPGEAELAAIERGYGQLRATRADDFDLYTVLEKLKLWWYFAERGAERAARDVAASVAAQIAD